MLVSTSRTFRSTYGRVGKHLADSAPPQVASAEWFWALSRRQTIFRINLNPITNEDNLHPDR